LKKQAGSPEPCCFYSKKRSTKFRASFFEIGKIPRRPPRVYKCPAGLGLFLFGAKCGDWGEFGDFLNGNLYLQGIKEKRGAQI
jgi:hypothetical protein